MEQEKQHGMGIEVHAPGQFWAKLTGADVKGLLIVIIILMATGALFIQAQENTKGELFIKITFLDESLMGKKWVNGKFVEVLKNEPAPK